MGSSYSHLVFQPPTPPTYKKDLEQLIWLEATSDRLVPAIYWQWQGRDGERAYFTILYSLGNAQDLGQCIPWLKLLSDTLHVDILCYEYTGYGLNDCNGVKPSEQNCYDDIYSAWSFLTLSKRISSDRIILFGKSLGSGPTLELAARIYPPTRERTGTLRGISRSVHRKNTASASPFPLLDLQKSLAGIILQSPMTSILNIERDKGNSSGIIDTVASLITNDMFENFKKVEGIGCPVFLIHGMEDEVIPFAHSKKLESKLPNVWRVLEVVNGHHFDLETEPFADDLIDSLIEFVESLTSRDSLIPTPKKKVFVPPAHFTSPTEVISAWLKHIGLEQYTQGFIIGGYFDMLTLSCLTEFDLECIGITDTKHQEVIMEAVKELQQTGATTQQSRKPPPAKPTLSSLVNSNIQAPFSSIRLGKCLSKSAFENLYVGQWKGKPISVRQIKSKEDIEIVASKINTLSELLHPNLLPFHAACTDSIHLLILEEWVSEGTLKEFLRRNEKIPLKMQVDFASDILVALAYLHSQNPPIFHGSLNSKNIMVHENAVGWRRIKLGGLGRWSSNSLAWTAPEVYSKRNSEEKAADENIRQEKIDIYAFGVICWEIVTAKAPFASQLAGCAAVRAAVNPDYRPNMIAAACPFPWLRIIERCWSSFPEDRPTLNEIADLLAKVERESTEEVGDHPNEKQDDAYHISTVFSSYSMSTIVTESQDDSPEKRKPAMARQRSFFKHKQSKQISKDKANSLDLEALTLEVSNSTNGESTPKKEKSFASFLVPNFAKALVHGHSSKLQLVETPKQSTSDPASDKGRTSTIASPKAEDEDLIQWKFPDRTHSETAWASESKRQKSPRASGSHFPAFKDAKSTEERELAALWAPAAGLQKGHRRTISLASVQRFAHAAHDFILLPVSPRSPSPPPSPSTTPPSSSPISPPPT